MTAVNKPTSDAGGYSTSLVCLYSILHFLELSYVALQGTSNLF